LDSYKADGSSAGSAIVAEEIEAEAVLENCRALIKQIKARLSAEKPFVNASSAAELLLHLESAAAALKKVLDQARQSAELISGIIGGAPRPQSLDRGSRRVLDRLSAFLSEDIGGALKGGVKVCQGTLVNELPLLVTEYAPNLVRENATPLQRAFQCGPLSRI
jgi:hypothetical protein